MGSDIGGGWEAERCDFLCAAGPSGLMRIRHVPGPAKLDRRPGTERPTFCSRRSVLRGCAREVQGVAGAFELAGAGQGGLGDEVGQVAGGGRESGLGRSSQTRTRSMRGSKR